MSYQIEKRLEKLEPYETVAGDFRIKLDANESFLPLSAEIKEKLREAFYKIEFNRYPDPYAVELCRAFADIHGIDPALVTAGNGSDELINLIIETFMKDGAKLLTLQPDFSMYGFYAALRRAEVIKFQKNSDYTLPLPKLFAIIETEKPDAVVFSNPCNPTGAVLSKETVLGIVAKTNALVIVDEAYMDFSDQSVLSLVAEKENLIVLRTLSKAYGAASLRLGFAVANPKITKVLQAAKSPYNVNAVSQAFGAVLLENREDGKRMIAQMIASRDELYRGLFGIRTVFGKPFLANPTGANFVLIDTEAAEKIYNAFLEENILVRKFPMRIRINAGTTEENREILRLLRSMQ